MVQFRNQLSFSLTMVSTSVRQILFEYFEVGFGTGLNALLTAVKSMAGEREVNYTSIEKYPVSSRIISSLNHSDFAGKDGKDIYNSIHSSPWNTRVNICKNFNLTKIKGDFTTIPSVRQV